MALFLKDKKDGNKKVANKSNMFFFDSVSRLLGAASGLRDYFFLLLVFFLEMVYVSLSLFSNTTPGSPHR